MGRWASSERRLSSYIQEAMSILLLAQMGPALEHSCEHVWLKPRVLSCWPLASPGPSSSHALHNGEHFEERID